MWTNVIKRKRVGSVGFGLVTAGAGKDVGKSSQVDLCTRVNPVNLFTMQMKCSVYCEPYLQ